MPKIVDWDARRDEILAATWRVIARDGIARATIRAIAREADCSRGILAHYFDDKADILGSALLLSHRRVVARMEARAAGLTGLAALRVIMLEALPLDSERDLEAQIEISFWGRALGNPALRRLQHTEFDRFTERLRGHLVEAGYLADRAVGSLVRFSFWMLGGAGLALAEAPEADRPRLREEWRYLIRQTISGLRAT